MMKETTLLPAALAALACVPAFAQGNLTIFGTVDQFIGHAKASEHSVMRLQDGGHGASQIGFQGHESLGGGWQARFRLEAGLSADTGEGTLPGPSLAFTRQSYVGIAGPAGSLDMGRMYTPLFYSVQRADPYGLNAVFSPLNLSAAIDAQPGQISFAPRVSNMVRYRSPAGRPLAVDLAYGFGEAAIPGRSGDVQGGNVSWTQGPYYLAYGIQRARSGSAAAPVPHPYISTYQALSAAYREQRYQLFAHFMLNDSTHPAVNEARLWSLAGAWQLTVSSRVLAEVARRTVSGSERRQWAWTLGYDHALSKRTTAYARLLYVRNQGGSAVALGQIPVQPGSGDSGHLMGVGLRHSF